MAGRLFWLGIALIVDGIDGPFARRFDVSERVPWFDGAMLDFVVDYATYVLVPAIILVRSGLLTAPYSVIAGIVVAVVGALYFADTRMKTPEAAFRGFPAVLERRRLPAHGLPVAQPVTLAIVAAFAILTFTPVEFVHPIRVVRLRPLTLLMAALWAVLGLVVLIQNLAPPGWVVVAFALTNAYFAVIGVALQLTRPASAA